MFTSCYLCFFALLEIAHRRLCRLPSSCTQRVDYSKKMYWRSFLYQLLTVCGCLSLYETQLCFYIDSFNWRAEKNKIKQNLWEYLIGYIIVMPSKTVNDVGSIWVIPQEEIGRFDPLGPWLILLIGSWNGKFHSTSQMSWKKSTKGHCLTHLF